MSEQQAWAIVDDVASGIADCVFRDSLLSVYLVGSLPRGDFYPPKSEMDLLFFLTPSASNLADAEILQGLRFVREIDARWRGTEGRSFPCVDIGPWIRHPEIPFRDHADLASISKLAMSPGRKYVTVYGFDFAENARLLWGTEIREELTIVEPRELVALDVARLNASLRTYVRLDDREWAVREARTGYRVRCSTMSVGRTLFLAYGKRTLLKWPVFRDFDVTVPHFSGKEFFSQVLVPEYLDPEFFLRKTDEQAMAYFQGCLEFAEGAASLLSALAG